ncbi:MAG: oligosaccharide flippase family protein, partial [Candidatus Latescibacteria bacterium]|nr:oligosaccharide flippase family protein [Candidatus Latescibacterota bacterium]
MNLPPRSGPPEGLVSVASRNAIVSMLARVSGVAVGLLLTPFVLGKLGRELYGIVVAATSAFEYMLLLRGGIGAAMRRHVTILAHSGREEQAKEHYRVGFWLGNLAHLLILLAAFLFADDFCRFLRLPGDAIADAARGVFLVTVALIVSNLTGTFEVPIYATGRLHRIQTVSAISPWIRLGVVFAAFTAFVPTLTVYGGTLVLAEIPAMLILAVLAQRSGLAGPVVPRPGLGDREVRREMLSYGGVALLSQVAALLYISTDNMLIGRIYGPGAVTHYSLGVRWEPIIRGFLWTPIVALAPLFTQLEARSESDRSRQAVRRSVALAASLSVPFCLVPCIVGDLFLTHWVGAEYRGSAIYLIAMLAPASLTITLAPVWAALVGRGRIGWVAVGDLIVAVLNVGASLLLALVFGLGLLGFALGNTLALLAKNLLLIPLAAGREEVIPRKRDLLLPLPRALLGGLPGLALLWLLRDWYGSGLVPV